MGEGITTEVSVVFRLEELQKRGWQVRAAERKEARSITRGIASISLACSADSQRGKTSWRAAIMAEMVAKVRVTKTRQTSPEHPLAIPSTPERMKRTAKKTGRCWKSPM